LGFPKTRQSYNFHVSFLLGCFVLLDLHQKAQAPNSSRGWVVNNKITALRRLPFIERTYEFKRSFAPQRKS
jgi:hypothetical protein